VEDGVLAELCVGTRELPTYIASDCLIEGETDDVQQIGTFFRRAAIDDGLQLHRDQWPGFGNLHSQFRSILRPDEDRRAGGGRPGMRQNVEPVRPSRSAAAASM
jgi:hypothetical protein